MSSELLTADIQLIQRILPHRYPFLLVDKVLDIDGTSSARGIKNVTINEPHFQGHFPMKPIMPGVLGSVVLASIPMKVWLLFSGLW